MSPETTISKTKISGNIRLNQLKRHTTDINFVLILVLKLATLKYKILYEDIKKSKELKVEKRAIYLGAHIGRIKIK